LAVFASDFKIGSKTPPIKQIRQAHHEIARLLAQGVKAVEISGITGYSQSRISILQNDPAFKNLMSFYETENKELNVDVQLRLRSLGLDAIGQISERLEESPEDFSNEELRKLAETVLDRGGFGPKSSIQVSHGIDAATLATIKAETTNAQTSIIIEAESYREPDLGDTHGVSAELYPQTTLEHLSTEG
jgi:hypothetical protein